MSNNFDFFEKATNVYRTKYFIVKQIMTYETHCQLDNIVLSQDTYYKRTRERDRKYNRLYSSKINIDGKRMPCSSYSRKYIQ